MFHDIGQAPEYFGPPQPGQTFGGVSIIHASTGGAAVEALLLGPIGAVTLGVGTFFAAKKIKDKSKAGGY